MGMGFLNQSKYRLLAVIIFFAIIFFIGRRLQVGDDMYGRMLDDRKKEHYSGIIEKKFIDNTEHNIPKLLLSDTIISLETEFWNKVSVGDSIVKIKGKSYVTLYGKGKAEIVFDYSKYFSELSGKNITGSDIYPRQQGLINDYENNFTLNQKEELSKILFDFNIKSKNKIIVVSLPSIPVGTDFQVFAENLGKKWKIDQNNQGRTILIAFSKKNRKVALTVAVGVTNLSDNTINKIVTEKILPEFKKDDYYQGVKNGTIAIIKEWR